MNRLKLVKWVMVSVSVVMLSACGGGGGDSAPSTPVAPTPEEIQQEAIETINEYDGSAGTEAPTVEDYEAAGVTGVNEGNIDSINEAVAEDDGVATEDDIQDVADVAGLVYEDAENGDTNGWDVYLDKSSDAITPTIANKDDGDKVDYDDKGSKVIKLSGDGGNNGYRFGADWKNSKEKIIKWSMKYDELFTVYILVDTEQGTRYLYYTPHARGEISDGEGVYFNHILEAQYDPDGSWKTIERNLQKDLEKNEPNNKVIFVHAFLIIGSGLIDDIEFIPSP